VIHRRTEREVSLEADAPPALWPQGEARLTVLKIIGTEGLVELFRLRQERFVRCAFDGDRPVTAVSLDEVLVEGSRSGRRWRELEIELLPDGREKDIADMAARARARFGLTPSQHSKFERALDGQS
jgi:inorganic triphosphatase YgiF